MSEKRTMDSRDVAEPELGHHLGVGGAFGERELLVGVAEAVAPRVAHLLDEHRAHRVLDVIVRHGERGCGGPSRFCQKRVTPARAAS